MQCEVRFYIWKHCQRCVYHYIFKRFGGDDSGFVQESRACDHRFWIVKFLYFSVFLLFTLSYFFCFMFRSQIIVMACPCTLLWFSLSWSRNTECWTVLNSVEQCWTRNTECWTLQFFNDSIQIRFQNSCSRNLRNLQSEIARMPAV